MAIGCTITVNTINKSKNTSIVKKKSDLSTYADEYFLENFSQRRLFKNR